MSESTPNAANGGSESERTGGLGSALASLGRTRAVRMLRGDVAAMIALSYLLLVILIALLAPLIAPADPAAQNLGAILQGPSLAHPLGTDDLGRDLLSRLMYGARVSLQAAGISVGVGLLIGVPFGLISGYFGGWVDAVIMRVVDTLLAFPTVVLAIAVGAALGRGLLSAMTAVGIVFSPVIARLVRGQVLALRHRLFVEAATTYGTRPLRMIARHILPNVVRPLIVQITFLLAVGLLTEAALSFLGLGVEPPTPSWGAMLQSSFRFIFMAPGSIYAPGLAIALTVLSFNLIGDFLNDVLDPKTPIRRRRRPAATTA